MNSQLNLSNVVSDLNASLTSLRDQIRRLNSDARQVASAAVPLDTAIARIDERIEKEKSTLSQLLPLPFHFCEPNSSGPPHVDFERILRFQQIDAAGDLLKSQVRDYLQGRSTMSPGERSAKLAKLNRERLDLELSEEAIIRQAEGLGFDIPRRADADVRAVLAHDKALP